MRIAICDDEEKFDEAMVRAYKSIEVKSTLKEMLVSLEQVSKDKQLRPY